MYFILGYLAGILTAVLIVSILTFFRRIIEHKITIIEKTIESRGPKPKGFIIEPESEADTIRKEIIEKNRKQGKDTKISELM